jgi:hypothetical protein
MHLFCWMFALWCRREFVSAQARHMKKPRRHIEKQAYNPLPCRKSLRIATTPRRSMAEETCSLIEGSRSERDTSNSSSNNLSNESKRTRCVYKQKLAMLKLHRHQQRRCPSWFKVNGRLLSHQNKLDPHINHVIMFPKWISKIGVTQSNPNVSISLVVFSVSLFFSLSVFLCFFVWSLLQVCC